MLSIKNVSSASTNNPPNPADYEPETSNNTILYNNRFDAVFKDSRSCMILNWVEHVFRHSLF